MILPRFFLELWLIYDSSVGLVKMQDFFRDSWAEMAVLCGLTTYITIGMMAGRPLLANATQSSWMGFDCLNLHDRFRILYN